MILWYVTYLKTKESGHPEYISVVIDEHPLLYMQRKSDACSLIAAVPVSEETYDRFTSLGGFRAIG